MTLISYNIALSTMTTVLYFHRIKPNKDGLMLSETELLLFLFLNLVDFLE